MIYCKIENGVVTNRAAFDEPMPTDWPDYSMWAQNDEAQIGWTYADGVFTAPPPPPMPDMGPRLPSQEEVVLLNHENRIRTQEGVPPLTMDDFLEKKRSGKL